MQKGVNGEGFLGRLHANRGVEKSSGGSTRKRSGNLRKRSCHHQNQDLSFRVARFALGLWSGPRSPNNAERGRIEATRQAN